MALMYQILLIAFGLRWGLLSFKSPAKRIEVRHDIPIQGLEAAITKAYMAIVYSKFGIGIGKFCLSKYFAAKAFVG